MDQRSEPIPIVLPFSETDRFLTRQSRKRGSPGFGAEIPRGRPCGAVQSSFEIRAVYFCL